MPKVPRHMMSEEMFKPLEADTPKEQTLEGVRLEGAWSVERMPGGKFCIQCSDFTYYAALTLSGDFGTSEVKRRFAQLLAHHLSKPVVPPGANLVLTTAALIGEVRLQLRDRQLSAGQRGNLLRALSALEDAETALEQGR